MDRLKQTLQSLPVPEPPASLKADILERIDEMPERAKGRAKRGYIGGGAALIAASIAMMILINSSFSIRVNAAIEGMHKNANIAISQMQSAIYNFDLNDIFSIK